MSKIRVYMACSLDGFIAGPGDDIDWLHEEWAAPGDLAPDPAALEFGPFLKQVGCLVMGRTTYDKVASFGGEFPYGEVPVLVATRRPLDPMSPTVSAVSGPIADILARAREVAGASDVYLDGGVLVQQALNAGLVDEITATLVPTLLGSGTRLFDGLVSRSRLQFFGHHPMANGMLQVRARVLRD